MDASEQHPGPEPTDPSHDLRTRSLRVHDVIISGTTRTQRHVIERKLRSARNATTPEELQTALDEAQHELRGLRIFESVDIVADAGPKELPDTANILVTVLEPTNALTTSIAAYRQGQEHTFAASGKLLNHLGHGESAQLHAGLGEALSNFFAFNFLLPHFLDSEYHLQNDVSYGLKSLIRHSSHTQSVKGFALSFHKAGHQLGYQLNWRTNAVTALASPAVHKLCGHSLLSSASYGFSHTHPDWDRIRPKLGYAVDVNTSVAGIGRGHKLVRFVKQEAEVRAAVPLPFANASLSCALRGGLLVPFGTSYINDRFFLGGAHDLRGFRSLGVGPTDARAPDPDSDEKSPKTAKLSYDSIGGDALLAATAALSFDLPHPTLKKLGVHGHVFGCVGNLTPISDVLKCKRDPAQFAADFVASTRASAGVGIVLPTPLGRIEINHTWVLRSLGTDKVQKSRFGIQLGVGVPAP